MDGFILGYLVASSMQPTQPRKRLKGYFKPVISLPEGKNKKLVPRLYVSTNYELYEQLNEYVSQPFDLYVLLGENLNDTKFLLKGKKYIVMKKLKIEKILEICETLSKGRNVLIVRYIDNNPNRYYALLASIYYYFRKEGCELYEKRIDACGAWNKYLKFREHIDYFTY